MIKRYGLSGSRTAERLLWGESCQPIGLSRTAAVSLMRPIRLEASLRMLSVGAISPNA